MQENLRSRLVVRRPILVRWGFFIPRHSARNWVWLAHTYKLQRGMAGDVLESQVELVSLIYSSTLGGTRVSQAELT